MIFELEGAKGMGDVLEGVFEGMRVVVHRVNAPSITGVVVMGVHDPIEHGIAQVHVRGGEVDFGAQDHGAIGKFSRAHATEKIEIFGDQTLAPRRRSAGDIEIASGFAHLLVRLLIDIGEAFFDERDGAIEVKFEVVTGEMQRIPLEAEPFHVLANALDVFDFFLRGISIIEA